MVMSLPSLFLLRERLFELRNLFTPVSAKHKKREYLSKNCRWSMTTRENFVCLMLLCYLRSVFSAKPVLETQRTTDDSTAEKNKQDISSLPKTRKRTGHSTSQFPSCCKRFAFSSLSNFDKGGLKIFLFKHAAGEIACIGLLP